MRGTSLAVGLFVAVTACGNAESGSSVSAAGNLGTAPSCEVLCAGFKTDECFTGWGQPSCQNVCELSNATPCPAWQAVVACAKSEPFVVSCRTGERAPVGCESEWNRAKECAVTSGGECVHGQVRECPCKDMSAGEQRCSGGKWSTCACYE